MSEKNIKIEYDESHLLEFANIKICDGFIKFNVSMRSKRFSGSTTFMSETTSFHKLLDYSEKDKKIDDSVIIYKDQYTQDSYIMITQIDNLGHFNIVGNIISHSNPHESAHIEFVIDQTIIQKLALDIKELLAIL